MPATKPSCLYFISESILYSIVLRNLADFARLATNLRPPPPSLPSAEGSPKVSASSPRFRKTILLYRTTKTASVRINLGVITFRSLSKRTLATRLCDEIRHPMNCLARYESLTSPDLHHDRAVTLSLSLPYLCAPPTQD